ncbi:hypothetical protein NFI96_009808 [Prochilodus magdalenae]|nr:hypothetical protein NFI96_009808 [Prochilodus magdalenae]
MEKEGSTEESSEGVEPAGAFSDYKKPNKMGHKAVDDGQNTGPAAGLVTVLQLLKTKTFAEDKEDSELTRSVKAKILDYMERKYEDSTTQSLLDTSPFLDPRFKADYISAENLIEIKANLMTEMKTTQMEREPVFDATAEIQTGSHQSHGPPSEKRKKRTLGSLLQSAISSTSSSVPLPTDQAVLESEFNSYLLMPTIDRYPTMLSHIAVLAHIVHPYSGCICFFDDERN